MCIQNQVVIEIEKSEYAMRKDTEHKGNQLIQGCFMSCSALDWQAAVHSV